MLVIRIMLPYRRCKRIRWYTRNFLPTLLPAAAPPEELKTVRADESQMQSDGPELPHPTETTRADNSAASIDLQEGDKELNGNPPVAFEGTAGTSIANGDVYACAECGVKMKGIFYVCFTCAGQIFIHLTVQRLTIVTENHSPIALCGDCAFREVFNVVKKHHPYKHWLVKIKDRVRDIDIGTSDKTLNNVDETTSLSLRVNKLTAMVESRFAEQDLRLSALVTQIDQLVHSLAALTGKTQLPSESVTV
jgi:hypothetical protein